MGMTYGGHGGTLGPGLVFGCLAGQHAAARAVGRG
jgi:3-oxosteroid 1-dehydrogenase